MGLDMSKDVTNEKAFEETILQCLNRDREWIQYHAEALANLTTTDPVDEAQLSLASVERESLQLLRDSQYEDAVAKLDTFCESQPTLSPSMKGWLLQLAARAAMLWGNEGMSQGLQRRAYTSNDNLLRPRVVPPYEPLKRPGRQAEIIVERLSAYWPRSGYIAAFEEISAHLVASASANQFEQALADFGIVLGFETDRPEKRTERGPDVLWLMDQQFGLVIEIKSRKKTQNPLNKDEFGQLLTSEAWFKEHYPTYESSGVIVHPNNRATKHVSLGCTKLLTLDALQELITETRQLLRALTLPSTSSGELVAQCERLLANSALEPKRLAARYLGSLANEL